MDVLPCSYHPTIRVSDGHRPRTQAVSENVNELKDVLTATLVDVRLDSMVRRPAYIVNTMPAVVTRLSAMNATAHRRKHGTAPARRQVNPERM